MLNKCNLEANSLVSAVLFLSRLSKVCGSIFLKAASVGANSVKGPLPGNKIQHAQLSDCESKKYYDDPTL